MSENLPVDDDDDDVAVEERLAFFAGLAEVDGGGEGEGEGEGEKSLLDEEARRLVETAMMLVVSTTSSRRCRTCETVRMAAGCLRTSMYEMTRRSDVVTSRVDGMRRRNDDVTRRDDDTTTRVDAMTLRIDRMTTRVDGMTRGHEQEKLSRKNFGASEHLELSSAQKVLVSRHRVA